MKERTRRRAPPGAESVPVRVRPSADADMAVVHGIYVHHMLYGLATFEAPPMIDELRGRRDGLLELGLPYLVAEGDEGVVGYCHASPYRGREGYRFTVEDSVYVAPGLVGRGVGAALLGALIAECEAGPWRQMIAVIGDRGNSGSVALHRRHGFRTAGVLRSASFKFGRWADSILMQRQLGEDAD